MPLAEVYEGASREKWGPRRFSEFHRTLEDFAVLPSTVECCWHWGEVRSQRRTHPIAIDDVWIAATSLAYECPLVTHNPKDFRGIRGLQVITAES